MVNEAMGNPIIHFGALPYRDPAQGILYGLDKGKENTRLVGKNTAQRRYQRDGGVVLASRGNVVDGAVLAWCRPELLAMLFCVVAPHVARLKGIFLINQLC